jgi:hypothetical protein
VTGSRRMQEVLRKNGVRAAVEKTESYFMTWQMLKCVPTPAPWPNAPARPLW